MDTEDAAELQTGEKDIKGGDINGGEHLNQHWLHNSQDFVIWETVVAIIPHFAALGMF